MTLIQSRNLAYSIFNFEKYSIVIKLAILVNKAVLLEIKIPAPGLIKPWLRNQQLKHYQQVFQ